MSAPQPPGPPAGPGGAQGGLIGPQWPAAPDCSFAEALAAGGAVLAACRERLPALPQRDLSKPCPSSLSEALALYHAREEEKRKKGLGKTAKAKKVSASALDHGYPGAKEGSGDQSAFWMYVEVSGWVRSARSHFVLRVLQSARHQGCTGAGRAGRAAGGKLIQPPAGM